MIDVFLSRPTWLPSPFGPGVDGFVRMLKGFGLNPRTLGTTDYPSKAPLDEVIALMRNCKGAVILGIPQITVTSGTVKGAAIGEPFHLPTEWNHIEAGLAYAQGLPLLVIHHLGVKRGIFDRGATPSFLYERDLSTSNWLLAEDLQGALHKWKHDCLLHPQPSPASDAPKDAGLASFARLTPAEREVLRQFIDNESKTAVFVKTDSGARLADTAHSLAVRGHLYPLVERRNLWFAEVTYVMHDAVYEYLSDHPDLVQ